MLDRKSCTRCGRCAENCPVQAIALEPYPSVDRDKCIMCYCCAELCPKKAMSVPSPVRGAIRNITRR